MKKIFLLLLFHFSFSQGCLKWCKSKEKEEHKAKRLDSIHQQNHTGSNSFQVSLKTKDEPFSSYTLPECWPQIHKIVAYDEEAMEWTVQNHDNPGIVEIIGPILTSAPIKHSNREYRWGIRPLSLGNAVVVACYQPKDGGKTIDERIYTIDVID